MEIAIMTGLFAKRDVNINAGHGAKVMIWRLVDRPITLSAAQRGEESKK